MDNSNNRDVNPYVQRVNAPDGGADDLRENYTENYAGDGCNDLGCVVKSLIEWQLKKASLWELQPVLQRLLCLGL